MNVPAAAPKETEAKAADDKTAKSSGSSMRDMAQRAKAAVMSIASGEKQNMVEKLWGKQPAGGGLLAYASADANVTGSIIDTRSQNPMMGGAPPYDRQTAVYDIAAKTVYLPDGTKLEAHSGLGSKMDDIRYSHVRMQGVTPPHIYELKPRETLFHGVPALRLTPLGGEDKDPRPRRIARAHLHARAERPVQRLRLVRGLLRLPRRLQEQGHPPPRGAGEGPVSGAGVASSGTPQIDLTVCARSRKTAGVRSSRCRPRPALLRSHILPPSSVVSFQSPARSRADMEETETRQAVIRA